MSIINNTEGNEMNTYEYGKFYCASKKTEVYGYLSPYGGNVVQQLQAEGEPVKINRNMQVIAGRRYGDRYIWGSIGCDIAYTYGKEKQKVYTCQDSTMATYLRKVAK